MSLSAISLFRLSRPRFWFYVLGPFLLGITAGVQSLDALLTIPVFILALFFLFPANLLIYGVNDIFDYETDKRNAKKGSYEELLNPLNHRLLAWIITLLCIPFILYVAFLSSEAIWAMAGFLFFGIFYSAKPIRAKTKPILDSFFNILYVFPGLVGYFLVGGNNLSVEMLIASTCWVMAMHAYSAVPDIHADKKAGIATVATFLGKRGTILFCLALYLTAAYFTASTIGLLAFSFGAIYVLLMLVSLFTTSNEQLFSIYKLFPFINALVGCGLFFFLALQRL